MDFLRFWFLLFALSSSLVRAEVVFEAKGWKMGVLLPAESTKKENQNDIMASELHTCPFGEGAFLIMRSQIVDEAVREQIKTSPSASRQFIFDLLYKSFCGEKETKLLRSNDLKMEEFSGKYFQFTQDAGRTVGEFRSFLVADQIYTFFYIRSRADAEHPWRAKFFNSISLLGS